MIVVQLMLDFRFYRNFQHAASALAHCKLRLFGTDSETCKTVLCSGNKRAESTSCDLRFTIHKCSICMRFGYQLFTCLFHTQGAKIWTETTILFPCGGLRPLSTPTEVCSGKPRCLGREKNEGNRIRMWLELVRIKYYN